MAQHRAAARIGQVRSPRDARPQRNRRGRSVESPKERADRRQCRLGHRPGWIRQHRDITGHEGELLTAVARADKLGSAGETVLRQRFQKTMKGWRVCRCRAVHDLAASDDRAVNASAGRPPGGRRCRRWSRGSRCPSGTRDGGRPSQSPRSCLRPPLLPAAPLVALPRTPSSLSESPGWAIRPR